MIITPYFPFLIFCSLWCCGLFAITRKGKIFDFVDRWYSELIGAKAAQERLDLDGADFTDHLKLKAYDPVIGCVVCMASIHTLYLCLIYCYYFNEDFRFLTWVTIAIPCSFLNEFLWQLRTTFVNKNKLLEFDIENIENADD